MTGVRNGPLVRYQATDTSSPIVGAVPNGFTWLIKSIGVLNTGPTHVIATVQLASADFTKAMRFPPFDVGVDATQIWEGWVAAAPGDVLGFTAAPGVFLWVSGAELPGVIP